jgi:hypothetical protein
MKIAAISRIAGAGAVAAVLVAALASCATLDEEQCRSVDWLTLGQQDGAAGRPASYIEEHRKACASHKLPVQDAPWHAGWEVGIRLYCTPQNGLTVGRDGGYYANSCPVDLKPGFETAYLVGKRVYEARTALSRAQADLEATMEKRLKAATEAERQALDREVVLGQSAVFAAQTRQISAEAAYDRYLAGMPRG